MTVCVQQPEIVVLLFTPRGGKMANRADRMVEQFPCGYAGQCGLLGGIAYVSIVLLRLGVGEQESGRAKLLKNDRRHQRLFGFEQESDVALALAVTDDR